MNSLLSSLNGLAFKILNSGIVSQLIGSRISNSFAVGDFRLTLPEDTGPEVRTRILFRIYERAEILMIKKWLPENLDCVELGGSIGLVSLHALQSIRPERRFVSVEAFQRWAEIALANIKNNFPDRLSYRVIEGAIFYGGDYAIMAVGEINTMGRLSEKSGAGTTVPALQLGKLVTDQQLGDYALICDIEGAEFDILKHDQTALDRCQIMIVEVHRDAAIFEQEMTRLGFLTLDKKHSVWVFGRTNSVSRKPEQF